MQKVKLLLVILLLLFGCGSTSKSLTEENMLAGKVFEFEGKTKKELYQKTLNWLSLQFVSADEVVTYKADDFSSVNANGIFRVKSLWVSYPVNHKLVFDFKDGKARITPTLISICATNGFNCNTFEPHHLKLFRKQINNHFYTFYENYQENLFKEKADF